MADGFTRSENEALAGIETAAGGRDQIYGRLVTLSDLKPEEERLLAGLVDPSNDHRPLAAVCAEHGFTVGRFLALLKRGTAARAMLALHDARAAAVAAVAQRLPEVASDVMLRAVSRSITCPECDGEGKLLTGKRGRPRTCPTCRGERVLLLEADQGRQELALQLGGLVAPPGRGAPLVSVTAQANAQAGAQAGQSLDATLGGMDAFVSRSDAVLLAGAAQPALPAGRSLAPLQAEALQSGAFQREEPVEAQVVGAGERADEQESEGAAQATGLPTVRLPYAR